MSKLLLWVCIAVAGFIGSLLPGLWGSRDLLAPIAFSTLGSIAGIWFWYKYLRYI